MAVKTNRGTIRGTILGLPGRANPAFVLAAIVLAATAVPIAATAIPIAALGYAVTGAPLQQHTYV